MTPPEASEAGTAPSLTETPPAVSSRLHVLKKRSDFVKASRAARVAKPGFVLQARKRAASEPQDAPIRVGFTCSKKVGNAVARNRAKRRLREVARLSLPAHGQTGWDYVLIGRAGQTAALPFAQLQSDFLAALAKLHTHPK